MKFYSHPRCLILALILAGCSESSPSDPAETDAVSEATMTSAISTYARVVSANYRDTLDAAQELRSSLQSFVADPTEDTLADARTAWLESREPYLQTEVFRFYGGPIDDDDGPEGMLNAWPLDEGYIDSVEGDPQAGIVNDTSIDLDASALEELNERGGEANIATGYHAIEFLLWGQDHDDDGPGDRPYTDYLSGDESTAPHPERRGEYLSILGDLLVEHLEAVSAEWAQDEENYRAEFEADEPASAIAKILTGMIILSGFETGGERLQAALDSGDQEDEHSCFSDNTHRDMIQDIQGVLNVYLGSYETLDGGTIEGTGIREVVEELDHELSEQLEDQIRNSLRLAKNLERPFDRAIALDNDEGRAEVAALVTSLHEQEGLLEDVFRALGLAIPAPE